MKALKNIISKILPEQEQPVNKIGSHRYTEEQEEDLKYLLFLLGIGCTVYITLQWLIK